MKALPFILLIVPIPFFLYSADSKPNEKSGNPLRVTTDEEFRNYQRVNGSLLTHWIDHGIIRGPYEGPGLIKGYDGPLVLIQWISNEKSEEEYPERMIPFESIICIDKKVVKKEQGADYIVYFQGPFGNTEWAILMADEEFTNGFLKRWKNFLLSLESSSVIIP